MDGPIEAFLKDVLRLQGETPSQVLDRVRAHMAEYEAMFRAAQQHQRSKDFAGRGCRILCRRRIIKEMEQRKGTATEAHLRTALSALDGLVG